MKTRPASWDDLRFLLAVHRDRSFFAAGRSLGVAASTVARRVEAVERSLGGVLVHRSNDGAQLDSDALGLVALAEGLELGLASLIRDGRDAEVSGAVRVSLSEGFVRPLVPLLARLQAKHPALRVEANSPGWFPSSTCCPSLACRSGTRRCSIIDRLKPCLARTSCAPPAATTTSRGGLARGSPAATNRSACLRTPERS